MSLQGLIRLVTRARLAAFAALAMAALFSATVANANCFSTSKAESAPRIPFLNPNTGSAPAPSHHDDDRDEFATIVGLWHVQYTATFSTAGPVPVPVVPPGTFAFLQSYKTWHADGTEFENAFLPPSAGNICFGVWKRVENHEVKLHHIGLLFAPDGSIAGVFTVDEYDRVAENGKTYSGSFDFKVFPPTDVLGTGTPLQEIKGNTAATRITVD